MFIEVVKSKIHKATVTEANLQYVGSITIDVALMEAANIIENEKVQIVNISYASMDFEEAKKHTPTLVFPDTNTNRLI